GFGELGLNSTAIRTAPTHVGTSTWKTIAAGGFHASAVRSDGSLWSWGDNARGELGDGTTTQRHVPTHIGGAVTWAQL
ncbi:hypothetical protein, partial [Escherichia coli]|uniref:hypothetical protein n=1 Tax=Escherichia coli TaxID=562 RepID=UPI0028DFB4AB